MPPPRREIIAVLVAVNAAIAFSALAFHQGRLREREDEKLAQIEQQRKVDRAETVRDSLVLDTAKKVLKVVQHRADEAKKKVTLHGDTAVVHRDSGAVQQIILPEITTRITTCDGVSAQKDKVIAHQDSVVIDLHRELIDAQQEIALLKKEKRPRFGLKTGLALGAAGAIGLVELAVKVLK